MQEPHGRPVSAILVIRGGGIGDFILTLPLLDALRAQWPSAALELISPPHLGRLATSTGRADACHDPDAWGLSAFFARPPLRPLPTRSRAFFSRFDLAVTFQRDREGYFEQNLAHYIDSVIGIDPARDCGLHAAQQFLDALGPLGIEAQAAACSIEVPPADRQAAQELLRSRGVSASDRLIVLHPGSGSPRKNWPVEAWAELIRDLGSSTPSEAYRPESCDAEREAVSKHVGGSSAPSEAYRPEWDDAERGAVSKHLGGGLGQMRLLLSCGEADHAVVSALRERLGFETPEILSDLPLSLLAGVLREASAYAGNDTGISHLAAAVGVPSFVLFGPTSPEVWRPLGAAVEVARFDAIRPADLASQLRTLAPTLKSQDVGRDEAVVKGVHRTV